MPGKEFVRQFGGKAAYIAFATKLWQLHNPDGEEMPDDGKPDWNALSKEVQEAWIAAAHEANMLKWIIETNGNGNGNTAA